MAAEPRRSFGLGIPPQQYAPAGGVCQHGFSDDQPGSGWTLGFGQQLGIRCASPGAILSVGFFVEFMVTPGTVDIVIYDNGVEVSRTNVAVAAAGDHQFDIPDVPIGGDACIMLCGVGGFHCVTGEDYTSPPYGDSFFSNNCTCQTAFTDNNLVIYAATGEVTPTTPVTWGAIRNLYR
jgi:hypothetical protein